MDEKEPEKRDDDAEVELAANAGDVTTNHFLYTRGRGVTRGFARTGRHRPRILRHGFRRGRR